MKVGWSFANTCTAFQCFQNSPEIFAGLPISSHIFGGINTNYCSTVWIMMIGTIVGVKHSTLSFLQIPLKFCPLCNNSPAIISGTPQFFIRRVNNTWGRWNCLRWLTSRLTGCQPWCAMYYVNLPYSLWIRTCWAAGAHTSWIAARVTFYRKSFDRLTIIFN